MENRMMRFQSGWPSWLLCVSGLLIFSPLFEGGTTHLAVMVIRLLVLLLLSLYLVETLRAGALKIPALRVGAPVLAFLGIATLSTIFSPYPNQSLQWLAVLCGYAMLLYLLVSFFSGWDQITKVLAILVGLGLGESVWAFIQAGWFGALRPSGTFFNPNFLAAYLVVIWSIALGVVAYTRVGRGGSLRVGRDLGYLSLPILYLGVLLSAVVLTGSRAGILTLMVGTGLVTGLRFGRKGLALVGVLALAGFFLPNPLRDRFLTEHLINPVGYARWQIWQSSLREMLDHPFGIGLGLYQYGYPPYAFPIEGQISRFGKLAQTAHNEYLQMGVELGVAGLVAFCWGVIRAAREARAVLQLRLRRWQRGVLVGVCAAMGGLLVHAALDSNLHEPALAILLILCASMLLAARRLAGKAPRSERDLPILTLPIRTGRARWVVAGCSVLLVGLLVAHVSRVGLAWLAFEGGSRAQGRQDLPQAIAGYRAAIALDPGKALYHSALGAAYYQAFEQTQDLEAARAALAELKAAVALNPLDGRLFGLLGHVSLSLAEIKTPIQDAPPNQRTVWLHAARSAYERAIELEPFTAFHRLELGRVLWGLEDRKNAQAIVEQAVELEPNFLPGREWLARLFLQAGQPEKAQSQYQEIITRQTRYAGWKKDFVEERFLAVDPTSLARIIHEGS